MEFSPFTDPLRVPDVEIFEQAEAVRIGPHPVELDDIDFTAKVETPPNFPDGEWHYVQITKGSLMQKAARRYMPEEREQLSGVGA